MGFETQTAFASQCPPSRTSIIYDESSLLSEENFLIDYDYPIGTYLKKIQPRENPPDPDLPKCSIPPQKINVDNKIRFRYLNGY